MVVMCMASVVCQAQVGKSFFRNELQLSGGLNLCGAVEMESAYSFLFNKYMGATLGLTILNTSSELLLHMLGLSEYYDDYRYYEYDGESAFLLRPALRICFPLVKDEEGDLIVLNVEPGVFLDLAPNEDRRPIERKHTYEKLFFHLKGYLAMDLNHCQLSLGCGFSNFGIDKYLPKKINYVSLLATISYRF